MIFAGGSTLLSAALRREADVKIRTTPGFPWFGGRSPDRQSVSLTDDAQVVLGSAPYVLRDARSAGLLRMTFFLIPSKTVAILKSARKGASRRTLGI